MAMPMESKGGLSRFSDEELDCLIEQAKAAKDQRKPNRSFSRWFVSFALLAIAFFVLFLSETSGIETDIAQHAERVDDKINGSDSNAHKNHRDSNPVPESMPDKNEYLPQHVERGGENSEPKIETEHAESTDKETATSSRLSFSKPSKKASGSQLSLSDFPLNKADTEAKIEAHKKGLRPQVRYQYKPRSTTKDEKKKRELAQRWGEWTLQDPKADQRPKDDFAGQFPSRDIPWEKFPEDAWQIDQDYLSKFLPEAKAQVERSMEAILGEYGWSKFDIPDKTLDERIAQSSFNVTMMNIIGGDNPKVGRESVNDGRGGWITQEYFDGLIRRLMHALITEDTFTLVMGGHSASAGHGNHFKQSYTLQFHKVMEPVFARLGVKLSSHNVGYGGLGTTQTSLAAGDLYGKEIDILVWDSSMTEKANEPYDLFVRQAYLTGNRIPVLLGGMLGALADLNKRIGAEVGYFGNGKGGVPKVENLKDVDKIPWMARYLRCDPEFKSVCRENEYNGTCWIDRPDYTPTTKQNSAPGGRASWHPGFRQHGIRGRIIAMTVLRAFHKGLLMWEESEAMKLPEEIWHVTDHYAKLRANLKSIEEENNTCRKFKDLEPKAFCDIPFNGVSEFTPRVNPEETSIRSIMKPAADGYLPSPRKNVYEPPDVFNPYMEVPEGEFDYLAVVENGIEFQEFLTFDNSPLPPFAVPTKNKLIPLGIENVKPGLGWSLYSPGNADSCDGTWDSFCNRGSDQNCLLYGHNDFRGSLQFDSYSGWGVFTVPNVVHGIIVIRLEWWCKPENPRTKGWKSENNGTSVTGRNLFDTSESTTAHHALRLGHPSRRLGGEKLCDTFKFEFVVAGKKTVYDANEFKEKLQHIQRVVQVQTLLNDPNLTNGVAHDVEVAVRITGCDLKNMFRLSHIYWA